MDVRACVRVNITMPEKDVMASAIQYQGRQARRQGSEQRRRAILEAALRIIVREGIRAVRHRAVAKEADVPLSATTYYFKDISDLIADAFTLFAEQAMTEVIGPFRDQAFALLDSFNASSFSDDAQRDRMIDLLTEMTTAFIVSEVTDKRDHLVAEQAFLHEAVLDERLRELANTYRNSQLEVLTAACEKFGSKAPALDAELVMAAFYRVEYELLVSGEAPDPARVSPPVRHALDMVVGHGQ